MLLVGSAGKHDGHAIKYIWKIRGNGIPEFEPVQKGFGMYLI